MSLFENTVNFLKTTTATADDQTAARAVFLYPNWQTEIEVKADDRLAFEGKLYKCKQEHTTQENWKPTQAASLWEVIEIDYAGTADDPIPFSLNMEVFEGKFYTWEGVLYKCIRSSGQALHNSPDELLDNYFVIA